jgi:hypothetical protein
LDGRSLREAAESDEGMLAIRSLIGQMEWHRRNRGFGAFIQSIDDCWMQEFALLLDVLPIAWGLHEEEFEQLLGVPPSWLARWRNQQADIDTALRERLRRLRRFHDALRLVVLPQEYAAAWRSEWTAESPIGQRSLWKAFQEDGDAALDRLENYFWAVAELTSNSGGSPGSDRSSCAR